MTNEYVSVPRGTLQAICVSVQLGDNAEAIERLNEILVKSSSISSRVVSDEDVFDYKDNFNEGMQRHNNAENEAGRTPHLQDAIDAGIKFALQSLLAVRVPIGCAAMSTEPGLYIKWSDAPDWANWFAADFFTQCWWYENKPVAGGNQWIPDCGKTMRAFHRTEWRETLQQRPQVHIAAPNPIDAKEEGNE